MKKHPLKENYDAIRADRHLFNEGVSGDVHQVQILATKIIHWYLLNGKKPNVKFKYDSDKIITAKAVDYRDQGLVGGSIEDLQAFIDSSQHKSQAAQIVRDNVSLFKGLKL